MLSFLKFSPCQESGWATPDQYIHACYSDLPSLYGERGLDNHKWAYLGGERAIEYPVITGVVMYATSWLVNSPISYFNINALLLALIFIGLVLLTAIITPKNRFLLPLAPTMFISLFINWDLWAIASMVLAIYWFDRQKYSHAALALGISIATKFMPIFLLLPIAFILWRKDKLNELVKFIAITSITWLAINLPVALTTPQGWWRFYKLNLERGPDWGSLWYALNLLGVKLTNINYLTLLLLLFALVAISIYLLDMRHNPTLASMSFIVLATVMVVGKVYSPQYVLWLTPLAIIALTNRKDQYAFWLWQGAEVIYHVAIWQHLATVTGANFGLPESAYALASLARIGASLFFIAILVRRALQTKATSGPKPQPSSDDFLFGSSKSYP